MKSPNLIYILSDDQRSDLLGCAGHPVVQTPCLDQLASEGTRFTHAFCTSPLCTPSRVGHYLGQWERKHGVNFNSGTHLSPRAWEQSFPMHLKQAGYFTGWVGKNHVPAGPNGNGYDSGYFEEVFDYWYGNHGHSGFYPKEQSQWGGEAFNRGSADTQIELFAEGALNFLSPQKDFLNGEGPPLPHRPEDQPFCLCVTFNLPHEWGTELMELRAEDDNLYRSEFRDRMKDLPIPDSYVPLEKLTTPKLPREVYSGTALSCYDYVRSEVTLRERMIRQCQTVTGIDRFVGRIRGELERLNLADNTLLVYSTDHGLHQGEHGLGGKALLYEEDLRIPLIVYDPREPNQEAHLREEAVLVPDLAPTVMELCGQPVPESMQGTSLVPLLRGEHPEDWRTSFVAENLMDIQNYPRSECLRTRDWKYIRYFQRAEDPAQADLPFKGTLDDYQHCLTSTLEGEAPVYEELYHLANDPLEQENLADSPDCRPRLLSMRAELLRQFREIHGEGLPLTLENEPRTA